MNLRPDQFFRVLGPGNLRLGPVYYFEGSYYGAYDQSFPIPPYKRSLLQQNETCEQAVSRTMGVPCTCEPCELGPGEYYPRISRPTLGATQPYGEDPNLLKFGKELAVGSAQLVSLVQRLEAICQVIHPEGDNLHAWGHEIRNLLILACTELEGQWRAIFVANGATSARLTTNDYVKLKSAMQLNNYNVMLSYYPWLPPLRPFINWSASGKPTQDLPWYDAYNRIKHDRETEFSQAKLFHVLNAVCASAIILQAQFGENEVFFGRLELEGYFSIEFNGHWPEPQCYLSRYQPDQVSKAFDFKAVSYPF